MKRLKETIIFATICLLLISALNLIGIAVCYIVSYLIIEYSIWEYLVAGTFHAALIFILVIVGGIKYSRIYVPFVYLGLCILVFLRWDQVSGYDFIFHLNFGFSQITYVIYETVRQQTALLTNRAIDLFVFNGLFFLYQMGLLYFAKKALSRYINAT